MGSITLDSGWHYRLSHKQPARPRQRPHRRGVQQSLQGRIRPHLKGVVGIDAEGLSAADWTLLAEISVEQLKRRTVMRNAQFSYPLAEKRLNELLAGKAHPLALDYAKAALAT